MIVCLDTKGYTNFDFENRRTLSEEGSETQCQTYKCKYCLNIHNIMCIYNCLFQRMHSESRCYIFNYVPACFDMYVPSSGDHAPNYV
jgi:hypothetical protein